VWSPDNELIDPFLEEIWTDTPPYEVAFAVRDYAVVRGRFDGARSGDTTLVDPPQNTNVLTVGDPLGIAMYVTANESGDRIQVRISLDFSYSASPWRSQRGRS